MGSIFVKTLIMFLLAFIISMAVALLIYWIRQMLTSVRINSFFDEKSKIVVRRAVRIHKIHDKSLSLIAEQVEHEVHPELLDFYHGINEEYVQPEDYHGDIKPIIRRKRTTKKHKNI
ncbi:MAG: hypothetical protein Q7U54_11940 [Bacteroidales bacterium]|nr:hypothetical protein [Bacteroidales bacterium]